MGETLRLGEYLLAIQGLAMIRTAPTRPSEARPRVDDIRRILDELPDSLELPLTEYSLAEGYTHWAEHYDRPNPAITREEPIVHDILAGLPPGRALDAACGTGRHAARLLDLGHQVVGVDTSPAMLAVARRKLPTADLRRGPLENLPVQNATVDLVTCALALTHAPDLTPVMREFARVLRPGGRIVLSDIHPTAVMTGAVAAFPGPAAGINYIHNAAHQVSDYLAAFRAAGLTVLDCVEPPVDETVIPNIPGYDTYPDAARQAFLGMPYLLIWELTCEQ
ncbi:MAG TPA: methyltransferase domain-containing protein [Actinophytocola sp.]|jgi:ubiquinone/menaquinone biosynthesis C-methylase UbiE|uniref:class I SAM-dependent methyltransferase n=1 Tax=Actinophytocola sp. TaxID=1872138 RepID=UPI002DF8B021|nr:methyltransferase domain-containing protein [Actinophytocola sp.]